jgi:L-asparagine transporter-like permease
MLFALVIIVNINSLSVSVANRLNIFFVVCKVLTILTVIIGGLVRIGQGLFFI